MGLTDTTTKVYTRENPVFADAFNFLLYSGQEINSIYRCRAGGHDRR